MALQWESINHLWLTTSLYAGYIDDTVPAILVEDGLYGQPTFFVTIQDDGAGSDQVTASVVLSASVEDAGVGSDGVTASKVLSASITDAGVGSDTVSASVVLDDDVHPASILDVGAGSDTVVAIVVRSCSVLDVGSGSDFIHVRLTDMREARTMVRFLDALHAVRALDDP
jgi:hypothetical protein